MFLSLFNLGQFFMYESLPYSPGRPQKKQSENRVSIRADYFSYSLAGASIQANKSIGS